MSIRHYQYHLRRRKQVTVLRLDQQSHTAHFVAFGNTSYSLRLIPTCACVPTMPGLLPSQLILDSFDTLLLQTTGNPKRYTVSRLHLPYMEGRIRLGPSVGAFEIVSEV